MARDQTRTRRTLSMRSEVAAIDLEARQLRELPQQAGIERVSGLGQIHDLLRAIRESNPQFHVSVSGMPSEQLPDALHRARLRAVRVEQ